MLRTSQSLLSLTQGLSLAVETHLLRSENVGNETLSLLKDINLKHVHEPLSIKG